MIGFDKQQMFFTNRLSMHDQITANKSCSGSTHDKQMVIHFKGGGGFEIKFADNYTNLVWYFVKCRGVGVPSPPSPLKINSDCLKLKNVVVKSHGTVLKTNHKTF